MAKQLVLSLTVIILVIGIATSASVGTSEPQPNGDSPPSKDDAPAPPTFTGLAQQNLNNIRDVIRFIPNRIRDAFNGLVNSVVSSLTSLQQAG